MLAPAELRRDPRCFAHPAAAPGLCAARPVGSSSLLWIVFWDHLWVMLKVFLYIFVLIFWLPDYFTLFYIIRVRGVCRRDSKGFYIKNIIK